MPGTYIIPGAVIFYVWKACGTAAVGPGARETPWKLPWPQLWKCSTAPLRSAERRKCERGTGILMMGWRGEAPDALKAAEGKAGLGS